MLSQYSGKDFIQMSPEDTVSQMIGEIKKRGIDDVIVVDDKKICLVDPHRILRTRIPQSAKLRSIMYPAPTLSPTDDLADAVQMIIENGLDAIPLAKRGKVEGIVSEKDLMKDLMKTKDFGSFKAEDIMTKNPFIITESDSISHAKEIMQDNNFEHLPVIDKSGKLVGIVTEKDLLNIVLKKEGFPQFDKEANKTSEWNAPVKNILNPNVVTLEAMEKIKNALNRSNFDSSIVVINENRNPIGIITPKDVLELVTLPKGGVYVQITGMGDEDEFTKKEMHAEVDRTVKKIAAATVIERLTIHVKRYSEKGRVKYSIRTKLVTDSDLFTSSSWEWDLIQAVGDAMAALEKQFFKHRDKIRDTKRKGR